MRVSELKHKLKRRNESNQDLKADCIMIRLEVIVNNTILIKNMSEQVVDRLAGSDFAARVHYESDNPINGDCINK